MTTGSDTSGASLIRGGGILVVATMAANAGNYLLNVVLGRWLTPAEFADANLMVTLMLLITAVAVSLQLIGARFAGIHAANGAPELTASLAASLRRRAAYGGVLVMAILALGATTWRDFFNSESALPFVILGLGMPAYLVQAVGRGVMQGELNFGPLAASFLWEMVARVAIGVVLVAAGFGVNGATVALTVSFLVTWLVVRRSEDRSRGNAGLVIAAGREATATMWTAVRRYSAPVAVLLLGQIIINNGDVLMSKRFLEPDAAGVYAAVALVGRAVFFMSWSVATTLFPAATQREESGEETDSLLYGGLAVVAVLGTVATLGARLLGGQVLGRVFGEAYGGVSSELSQYALATAVFAMANLIVSHHLALGRVREAVLLVAGGVVQTVLLYLGRSSVDGLIRAQIVAMFILLVVVSISHMSRRREAVAAVGRPRTLSRNHRPRGAST